MAMLNNQMVDVEHKHHWWIIFLKPHGFSTFFHIDVSLPVAGCLCGGGVETLAESVPQWPRTITCEKHKLLCKLLYMVNDG